MASKLNMLRGLAVLGVIALSSGTVWAADGQTQGNESSVASTQPAASPPAASPAAPGGSDGALVAEGHEIFNGTCSHCHGPDAVQSVKKIDLRLLHHRYGDDMENVFQTTVHHGRPSKGMPNWSGVFTEDDFTKIFAFLKSVQTAD